MKAAIILFSPSGNTNRVGELLKSKLEENNIRVQLINISTQEKFFHNKDKGALLEEIVNEHDILFIGSPVYAHHLQYHVKDLISSLPVPRNGWGGIAVPFVTYGGISSGIALDEAGKLLKKSGRKVLAGMKVSSSHRMTRAFMDEEYNKGLSEVNLIEEIHRLVKQVKTVDFKALKDNSQRLKYQNRITYLKANIIFKEKVWHEKRYPKVEINKNLCVKCGKCTKVCPVLHLKQDNNKVVVKDTTSQCVHCFNCIIECPQNAIKAVGDLERARSFMGKMIKKDKENPGTYLY